MPAKSGIEPPTPSAATDTARRDGQAAMLAQVGRVPRQVEVRAEEEARVAEADPPHVRRQEDAPPRRLLLRRAERVDVPLRVDAADLRELLAVDVHVVLGPLAVEPEERHDPQEAERAEDVEHHAPAVGEK